MTVDASAMQATPGLPGYDVFNGDADGICALHQLRMAQPREHLLITGVKRDIELLRHLPCDRALDVTVLDVCFDRNVDEVRQLLDSGARVQYFDHHAAQSLFRHPHLDAHIDLAADVCTSLLVDRHLGGRYKDWAIVGAFGDNLLKVARPLAQQRGHSEPQIAQLQHLGMLLNYNAYGEAIEDLHLPPLKLYEALHPFENPLDFIAESPEYALLHAGYDEDQQRLATLAPAVQDDVGEIFVLTAEAWARRLSGSLANQRVAAGHGRSVSVLTPRSDGGYLVSVRVNEKCALGADELCRRYPGGNGRRAAAGIDRLPEAALDRFVADFFRHVAHSAG
jgi:hypothetical protein